VKPGKPTKACPGFKYFRRRCCSYRRHTKQIKKQAARIGHAVPGTAWFRLYGAVCCGAAAAAFAGLPVLTGTETSEADKRILTAGNP